MFSSLTQRIFLGIYIFILLSIPLGAYLATQYQTIKSSAKEETKLKPIVLVTPPPTQTNSSAAKELLSVSQASSASKLTPIPSPSPDLSPTIATSFGPTLSLKANLEGRPADNQAAKLFVGIIDGSLTTSPKFLLSFTVNLPKSGSYSNLSLAGLTTGSKYTAIIKGPAQIANSSTFTMSPAITNLENGDVIKLVSGDLNEDNVINSADYLIAQKALGSSPGAPNWNENADLNNDGVVNIFDLTIISNNIGKTGATGAWTSPIPKVASPSASLLTPERSNGGQASTTTPNSPPVGSPDEGGGYWVWIPK